MPGRARLGDRGGGAAHVRDARRLGRGRGEAPADPRHGDHRQPARRCGAAGVPDLRRRDRAGEPFAHMVENAALVGALRSKAEARGVDARRPARSTDFDAGRAIACRSLAWPDGATITAKLLVAADGGRSAARTGRHRARMAGTTASPASSPRWRMSAITTAAPRNIFCPAARSPSCRSQASAPRWSGPSAGEARASSRCPMTSSMTSSSGASA